tara:strand:- start:651 stop:860 length:210 start_codon:yes stop_codon:yes gene_type:complete
MMVQSFALLRSIELRRAFFATSNKKTRHTKVVTGFSNPWPASRSLGEGWWDMLDLNQRPPGYEPGALTN